MPCVREPDAEQDVAHLLVEVGVSLGQCNFPSPQAEQLVLQVAHAYGGHAQVAVLPTLVIAEDRQRGSVAVERVTGTYRFDQIAAVQNVVGLARGRGLDAREATQRLLGVADVAAPYPGWLRVIGYALGAVGYAAAIRATGISIAVVALLAVLVVVGLLAASGNSRLQALMPVTGTFVSALVVSLAFSGSESAVPVQLAAVPVLVLLPGAALTAAVIELVSGDMIAGASRLIYAVMILVSMAFGFSLAVRLAGVPSDELVQMTRHSQTAWLPWAGAGVFVVGMMLYFCTPGRFWVPSLVVAYLAYGVQVVTGNWVGSAFAAGLASATGLMAASAYNYRRGGGPLSLALFLPVFWLLVPGSVGFVALTGAAYRNHTLASLGIQTGVAILAMAIGVMVASLVTPIVAVARDRLPGRGPGVNDPDAGRAR